jgi:hypothetical protein
VPSLNTLEVGDVVRVRLPNIRDFVANGTLDRSFEIQSVKVDWVTGATSFDLFGSSQAPGALAPSADTNVLTTGWYTGTGTNLATVLTITGANPGHVTVNGTVTGSADMTAAPSIFYYNSDLQIDAGVTVNVVGNVQLRVKGFLQNNGTINGKGNGLAGAAAAGAGTSTASNPGTQGFIGTTESGGGVYAHRPKTKIFGGSLGDSWMECARGLVVAGKGSVVPAFNLSWDGAALLGLPSDLRSTSGSSGLPVFYDDPDYNPFGFASVAGGAGGAGGAGLAVICRGFAQGAAGKVDLSGADGSLGGTVDTNWGLGGKHRLYAGSGAGGAPGALVVILDGASLSATGLTDVGFVALYGKTPQRPDPLLVPSGMFSPLTSAQLSVAGVSSYYVGTGDGTTFPLPNLSGARGGSRVQYVPNNNPSTVTADLVAATLPMPSNLGLTSGTNELLLDSDGTVIVRVKATWTPSADSRVTGYDLQFKRSTDTVWTPSASVIGQATAQTWLAGGIQDGINYDVRIRSAGALRGISDWLTLTGFLVVGKTAKPTNVGPLSFTDPLLTWSTITDVDRRGYIVKYNAGTSTTWLGATPAHTEGFVTSTKFDVSKIVGGQVTFLVKSFDTSGNESATAAALTVDLSPPTLTSFLISRQPDGTREFTWSLLAPPADLAGYRIRYFLGTTAVWSAMTALHSGLLNASPFESNQLAAGTYTFAAKAVDTAGNESAAALFITTVTIGSPRIAGSLLDFKEEPVWPATKTDCHVDATTGWLVADNATGTWLNLPATWTNWLSWNHLPKSPIIYTKLIDVGVKTLFTPLITVTGDGTQVIEEQHSDDNITYTGYVAAGPQLNTRYVRIRVTMTFTSNYPKFKTMRIILSANPVEEIIQDQDTALLTGAYRLGVGDVRLPITKVYAQIRKVDVTLQSVAPGFSWVLIDKNTTTGPRIKIYNAANALADAVIDATVTGV